MEKAIDGKYKTPKKFQKAIKRYKRGVNFKTRASILGAAALLSVSGFQAYNNHIYQSSIDQVRDRLAQVESSDPLLELTPRIADKKIKPLVEERVILPGDFPYSIPKGKTEWIPTDGTSWTSGFWPALLWRSFQTTGDPQFKEWAYEWIENMKVPEEKRRNPDEEFFTKMDNATINTIRFYYSHALGYDITKDEELKKVALSAADLMAKERFNLQGGFIQTGRRFDAYNYPRIHVDAMTTGLPLLCWAYDQSKDPQLLEKIISHCEATKDYNVNEDGSTIQVMSFSPDTEVRLGGFISHGFDEDSCLARGQARAIKGFCLAYKTTLDERFLDTAENCADYFLTNLPKDKIPDYDFKDPKPGIPKDTSAAAIAASGLLDLHEITGKPRYKTEATKILRSLSQTHLSSGNEHEGFLKNACINNNKSIEGGSVIYGGYPLFESLFRLRSYRMAH